MARPLRVNLAGSWNHVVSRGNGGEVLFRDDTDRRRFLGLVSVGQWGQICNLDIVGVVRTRQGTARPLRVNLAGSWIHVLSRGNGGEMLFRDDTDRRRFLGLVSELP
ncbi:MAG: hypothetical protein ACKOET_03050 [Verrucomicrobiota bacterium]